MKNQMLCLFFLSFYVTSSSYSQLTHNFYQHICPNVESIVRSAVTNKFNQTFVTAPATLRLFFHDCFVRVCVRVFNSKGVAQLVARLLGCDASVLLSNAKAEKDHHDDVSLAGDGFDTVVKAKAAVDSNPSCRNKVSCADILALATRDVVALTGGPSYKVELGRRDGRISTRKGVQHKLPHADFNLDQLNTMFASHGLSQTDMIALSGKLCTYTGFSHCGQFSKRIHSKAGIDRTLNRQYALQLREMCPVNVDPRIAINMDPTTPQTFDNAYYKNLQQGKGLFTSDQVLFMDARSRPTVNQFASNNNAFNEAFVSAVTKLGRVGVLTGYQGEIRRDCCRVN
ncbi:putative peroxidase [Helianthus annuus]|nr:putative peroxidase [Helianthus annuus]KAJ0701227.1 putative peroxidase [Helianthus annuus]